MGAIIISGYGITGSFRDVLANVESSRVRGWLSTGSGTPILAPSHKVLSFLPWRQRSFRPRSKLPSRRALAGNGTERGPLSVN